MTKKALIEASVAVSIIDSMFARYRSFEETIERQVEFSRIRANQRLLSGKIKTYFRNSFIGRISGLEERDTRASDTSRFVSSIDAFYRKNAEKRQNLIEESRLINSVGNLTRELSGNPVKKISIVTIIAILANAGFSILFKRPIDTAGWVIRGGLLFVGLWGLFSGADLKSVKETSVFLKILNGSRIAGRHIDREI